MSDEQVMMTLDMIRRERDRREIEDLANLYLPRPSWQTTTPEWTSRAPLAEEAD